MYMFLPVITGLVENPPGAAYAILPEHEEFEFLQTINISARSFTINITIPQSSQYQQVYVTDESPYPKTVMKEYNRTWWSYSLTGAAQIKIHYSGETTTAYWRIDHSEGVGAIPQWLKTKYDHPEYLEDSTGKKRYVITPALFTNVTEKITAGKSDVVGKLRAIYDYIVQNFHYKTDRNPNPQTPLETWNNKSGDCDELSFLFASMARSIGIPAWVEYGFLYTGSTWGQHAWIQTAIPYQGTLKYVNIDLTVEVGRKDLGMGFLVRDPYRITEWVEDGNSSHLSSYYHYITYTEPPQLSLSEHISILKMKEIGSVRIYVGPGLPSWLMALIFGVIIFAAVVIIIKM
ncbi:MAG: transglutaminase domain-containing protein [Euryarchaeota archaeon]|nr:transglutaminase domain-containing protein [Euryarchaeota archaeon]